MVQKRNPPPRAAKKAKPLPAAATPSAAKAEPKRRGRPRAYQPEVALARALDVFWKEGFAGTSLDDLSAATGKIGRASCRERGEIAVGAGVLKKNKIERGETPSVEARDWRG